MKIELLTAYVKMYIYLLLSNTKTLMFSLSRGYCSTKRIYYKKTLHDKSFDQL